MIPVCYPFIGEKELEYVTGCVRTNWISSKGKHAEESENILRYYNFKYGFATTFVIVYCGAKPVLVNAKPDTWNTDTKKLK